MRKKKNKNHRENGKKNADFMRNSKGIAQSFEIQFKNGNGTT